ncbi:putative histidinol-phosphatase [Desulfosarcina alkanivorans]|uniref:Histidinol-phosphatase n=1 Tax=Desulfosarcina alkanivorans TaxID=571177 RepID=A0A5K7YKE4_9BACT|nr:histidinol-phosphatase HisJ family protein [Desulfosarcina alkanivorans]BBO68855.1 putative histidinol-phosphatase [Desulfosarcina alkanivorans]
MIDYHVHTSLCNHAAGTMEQYVRAAVDRGLSTICFLDHLTFQEAGRPNAMFPREVPMYVYQARRLARQYRDRITVRVGLEIDFSPRHVDRCREIVDTFDLDVVGGSVHFLDGEDVVSRRSAWASGERVADDVYTRYLGVLESMLDYDYFDVVCHLDLPKKYNQRPSPSVRDGFEGVLAKIRENHLAVELNTSGLHHPVKEAFPSPDLLRRCARLEIPVVTGSDAHAPESVGREFDRARDLLNAAGYRHLTGFSHREREIVPL